jgi:hypothetical protein
VGHRLKEQIALANEFPLDSIWHVASVAELEALPVDTGFVSYRRWQAHSSERISHGCRCCGTHGCLPASP